MNIEIAQGYRPGCIGRIAELHACYYHRHAGFGSYFEAKVATELSQFVQRQDSGRDGLWLLVADNAIEGAIAIAGPDADAEPAHLRWFILSERIRGGGWGRALLREALGFCRERQYQKTQLWTFAGLHAARHLYEAHGFHLVAEHPGERWGSPVTEQCFEWVSTPG